jgi:hypothetical protein
MKTIENGVFQNCKGLIGELVIPDGVERIGHRAFNECKNLSGVLTIPNSVKTIGNMAFKQCNSFTGIKFGSGLDTIYAQCH